MKDGRSPVYTAAAHNHSDCLRILLSAGANIEGDAVASPAGKRWVRCNDFNEVPDGKELIEVPDGKELTNEVLSKAISKALTNKTPSVPVEISNDWAKVRETLQRVELAPDHFVRADNA